MAALIERVGFLGEERSTLYVGEHGVSMPWGCTQVADSAGDRQAGMIRRVAYTVEGSRVSDPQEIRVPPISKPSQLSKR